MNLFETWSSGLPYGQFLSQYGTTSDQSRWKHNFDQIKLTSDQQQLLQSFRRRMPVLCLAGAWCGDCASQCPIFEHFSRIAPGIDVRYLDRDDYGDVQTFLRINGGNRVPVLVFFSEDGFEVARYGERTLSQYRYLAQSIDGAACPSGLSASSEPLGARMVQDWLNEFERVQLILRLSPRLRQLHRD